MQKYRKILFAVLAAAVTIFAAVFAGSRLYNMGYEKGFDKGHSGWYAKGYDEGSNEGYISGYDAGFSAGTAAAGQNAKKTDEHQQNESDIKSEHENGQPEHGGGEAEKQIPEEYSYVLNTNSKRFHKPDCKSVPKMKEENKDYYTGSREELIQKGYKPCGSCNP